MSDAELPDQIVLGEDGNDRNVAVATFRPDYSHAGVRLRAEYRLRRNSRWCVWLNAGIYLSHKEMDRLCDWWTKRRSKTP